jgi:ribosome maturation factor RimP
VGFQPTFLLKASFSDNGLCCLSRGEMEGEMERVVSEIVEPIVTSHGMELIGVEYRRETGGWVLRIYIDKKGGVSLDDCVLVSNEVGPVIDVEDLFQTPYTMEVSSPGLNRALKKARDFERFKGRVVKIRTHDAIGGRRNFKGRLLGCTNAVIQIGIGGEVLDVPLLNVAKANLEFES